MAYEMILLNIEGRIATISLNRPPMNPLNSVILREITEAISEIEADENVKVVIVNSVGERAFAAGADVKEMVNLTPVELYDFCQGFRKACESLNRYALPVIAVIKGLTLGTGHVLRFENCSGKCQVRSAGNQPGHPSRRRRNAAIDPADRSGPLQGDDPDRGYD